MLAQNDRKRRRLRRNKKTVKCKINVKESKAFVGAVFPCQSLSSFQTTPHHGTGPNQKPLCVLPHFLSFLSPSSPFCLFSVVLFSDVFLPFLFSNLLRLSLVPFSIEQTAPFSCPTLPAVCVVILSLPLKCPFQ